MFDICYLICQKAVVTLAPTSRVRWLKHVDWSLETSGRKLDT